MIVLPRQRPHVWSGLQGGLAAGGSGVGVAEGKAGLPLKDVAHPGPRGHGTAPRAWAWGRSPGGRGGSMCSCREPTTGSGTSGGTAPSGMAGSHWAASWPPGRTLLPGQPGGWMCSSGGPITGCGSRPGLVGCGLTRPVRTPQRRGRLILTLAAAAVAALSAAAFVLSLSLERWRQAADAAGVPPGDGREPFPACPRARGPPSLPPPRWSAPPSAPVHS